MTSESILQWINAYFLWLLPFIIVIAYLLYMGIRFILARSAYSIALRTENVYDDLIVDRLQPFRIAWLVPLLLIYFLVKFLVLPYTFISSTSLVLVIWIVVDFITAILSGINDIYKQNPRYTGVSVAGYVGIIKVVVIVGGIVLTISFLFEVEPIALLSGVGAWLAVLLLIFRDTILSFLASIQISTQQLIKEGDEVDVPAFGASGVVRTIELQTITIQNFDNTLTNIPTSKIVDVGFKNFRGMHESGTRRLKKAVLLDANTVKFSNDDLIIKLTEINLLKEHIEEIMDGITEQTTNLQLFMNYANAFLNSRKEIRKRRYPFIVRILEPTSEGLPLEIVVFVKASTWDEFENLQAEILIHLMAVLPYFDLQIFQL